MGFHLIYSWVIVFHPPPVLCSKFESNNRYITLITCFLYVFLLCVFFLYRRYNALKSSNILFQCLKICENTFLKISVVSFMEIQLNHIYSISYYISYYISYTMHCIMRGSQSLLVTNVTISMHHTRHRFPVL